MSTKTTESSNPEFKKDVRELNREGWEMHEGEGGAAVRVKLEGDETNYRALLESEGKATDLESYIRLHNGGEVRLPSDYLTSQNSPLKEYKAGIAYLTIYDNDSLIELTYKSKTGDIKQLNIKLGAIANADNYFYDRNTFDDQRFEADLNSLGFTFTTRDHNFENLVGDAFKAYTTLQNQTISKTRNDKFEF